MLSNKARVSEGGLPVKAKLYQHQIDGAEFALRIMGYVREPPKSKSSAILAEMGCGKTMITIAVAGRLYLDGHIERMLVVCPKSIVGVWREEFLKFADFSYHLEVLEGSSSKKELTLRGLSRAQGKLQVAVVNYESARLLETQLAKYNPCLIVCDESTKIKNPTAKQAKTMHRLGKKSKHNLILTGSPITASPLDFFSQYKFLDEEIFGTSFYSFRARYAVIGGYGNHQIIGYKNLDDLTRKAHSIAYRITKAEALDLPEQVDIMRQIDLERAAMNVYKGVERDCVAEIESGEITAPNILTKLTRLSQITGGFVKSNEGDRPEVVSNAKLEALSEIIEERLEQGKKIVVFVRYLPEVDAIERMLKKSKIGYALVKGSVKDRDSEVERFQTDPECKVFVGQLQTTGMGLTLTAADTAVYYSYSYNFADYEQAKARIHRISQRNTCTYIHLIASGTIDESVIAALKAKKNMADLVVDNWRSLLKADYDDTS